jgi:hypothetical protein
MLDHQEDPMKLAPPSHPPKAVKFGEQTTDEMGFAFLQVALPDRADVPGFRRAMLLSRIEEILALMKFLQGKVR